MFTDIVGYTALTQENESATVRLLETHRRLIRPIFVSHGGREIKTIGDAFLVEFNSALDAVLCSIAVQQVMHDRKLARGDALSLRIGIHVGDVIASENDIVGDAVNIASRVEPLAEQGGVCITSQVYEQVRNKSDLPFVPLGEKSLKNVTVPVAVYKVVMPWEKSGATETITYPANRIAILPFASFSPDPNDAFFADGITDEIISAVAGISSLSVISRTSVIGYKGTTKKVKEIGKELEVGSILEGTFKKAGNRIRVTAQLIDVAGDRHLWAQNYDRSLDDVFEVQSDVAKQVADALRVRILSPERERFARKPTESTAAYILYLKGMHHLNKRGIEDVRKALEYFELAAHEDPAFALGYVGQADCRLVLRANWNVDLDTGIKRAGTLLAKALEIDPDLAEAHATKGTLLMDGYDLRHAEEELRRAIELKPSYATAHLWYFMVLVAQQRWDEALAHLDKSLELDPLSPLMNFNHGAFYWARRDYARAIEGMHRAAELGFNGGHGFIGHAYGEMKMFDDMKREYATHVELLEGSFPLVKTFADADMACLQGDKQTLRRLLPELETGLYEGRAQPLGMDATWIAGYYFFLGEKDRGFEWLERSYARRESHLLDITFYPQFDSIRTDPRYLDLLKRIGLE